MDSFTSGYPYLLLPALSVLALWLILEVWRAPVQCPKCGNLVDKGLSVCPHCGMTIK